MTDDYEFEDEQTNSLRVPSVYDQFIQRLKTVEKRSILSRVFLISKNRDVSKCIEQFSKLMKSQSDDTATGILLVYPKYTLHILEIYNDEILETIRLFNTFEKDPGCCVYDTKVLRICNDVQSRLLNQWYSRLIDLEQTMGDVETTVENAIIESLSQLLKLCVFLSKTPKQSMKAVLDTLPKRVPECLPSQDVILFLLDERDQILLSLEECVRTYTQATQIAPESELTWPMLTRLFPLY